MILVVAQARCGSSRFPNKVFQELNNKTIIETIYDRIKLSKYVNKVVIATSTNIEDDKIQELCDKKSIVLLFFVNE